MNLVGIMVLHLLHQNLFQMKKENILKIFNYGRGKNMYCNDIISLKRKMCETLQFKDMNVLEHGISVNKHYVKLIKDLESSSCSEEILIKIYNKIKDKY